jgi:uncharacterized tellurite resistance protein B-like protein
MNELSPLVRFELLKLLLQVAWADHEIQEEERVIVTRYADKMNLPADFRGEALAAYLDGKARLPAPDLTLLKQHREKVMFAVKSLARADLQIHEDETEIVEQIRAVLYDRD